MERHCVEIPDLFDDNDEVRKLSAEGLKLPRLFSTLSETEQAILRGFQTSVRFSALTIVLPREVVEPFRAHGEGWEWVVEGVPREWLRDHAA